MKPQRRIIPGKNVSKHVVLHAHSHAIRKYHIKSYQTQLQSLNQAKEKMRHYVEHDQPAFSLWWQQEFSGILSEQLILEKTVSELQLLIDATDLYVGHYKGTHARGYAKIFKAHTDGALAELMSEIFAEKDRAHQKQAIPDDFLFEEPPVKAKIKEEGKQSKKQEAPPSEKIQAPTPEETTDGYIKKIYRELVRRLHPDVNEHQRQSAEEKALWHELQNAYEWRDLGRMEEIFKALHGPMSVAMDFQTVPIGDILAMKEDIIKKLVDLRKEMKRSKKEANWDFGNRRLEPKFLRNLGRHIQEELAIGTVELEYRIEKYRKLIQSWTTPSRNKKQKGIRYEDRAYDAW